MPTDQLTKDSPDHEIERDLFLDSGRVGSFLKEQAMTPDALEHYLRLVLRTARREDRPSWHWQLAVVFWITDRKALALKAARLYLKLRPPSRVDRAHQSAGARLDRKLRKRPAPGPPPKRRKSY